MLMGLAGAACPGGLSFGQVRGMESAMPQFGKGGPLRKQQAKVRDYSREHRDYRKAMSVFPVADPEGSSTWGLGVSPARSDKIAHDGLMKLGTRISRNYDKMTPTVVRSRDWSYNGKTARSYKMRGKAK